MQVVSRWKDSKDKIVSPENRTRSVILPANIWGGSFKCETGNENTDKLLRIHLLDSFAELAKDYLSAMCEESKMLRREIPLEQFTLSSLLAWQQEQAALSGRLNGEEIKKWIANSATVKAVESVHGAEIGKAMGEQFVKLASPNHGLTAEKAAKILANLWKPEDCENLTGLRVQMRLTAIANKPAQTQNMLDSIL